VISRKYPVVIVRGRFLLSVSGPTQGNDLICTSEVGPVASISLLADVSGRHQVPYNHSLITGCSKHHKDAHTRKYECDICGNLFGTARDRDRHMRTHVLDKPFGCGFQGCGFFANRRDSVVRHFTTQHMTYGVS
jgi:hypothetical protein